MVSGENVKHRDLNIGMVKKSHSGIGLRIEINQKSFFLFQSECGRKVDRSGGLSNAALLIGN